MAYKNIKKKKLQNFLIAMIIGVSALVLSTGIGLLKSFDAPAEKMLKETNASHNVLYFAEGLYSIEEVKAWLLNHPNIEGITHAKAYNLNTKITIHNKKVDKSLRIGERPAGRVVQDKLLIVDGEKKDVPDAGEIWVPTSLAYSYNIKVGDQIRLPTKNGEKAVKVAAIVVDPVSSSSLIGTISLWVRGGEIENIFDTKYNTELVGLKLKDLTKEEETWKDFESFLKVPFGGYRFRYEDLKSCYNAFIKISGALLIGFSFIVIVCAIFIIAFTISNSILGDYKTIGILKSQGFNSKQIRYVYELQFLILSIISIPFGIGLGYLSIKVIMSGLLKSLGINSINTSMVLPSIITYGVIFFVIICTTFLSSKKTIKIKPAEALKSVSSESVRVKSSGFNLMKGKRFTLPLSLAIKQMSNYKRQGTFIAITLFLVTFVFTSTVNSYNSLLKLGSNMAYFGFDTSEVTFQFPQDLDKDLKDKTLNEIKRDSRVKNVVPWSWFISAYKTERGSTKVIEILAYDGDMDSIGIMNLKGRNPITLDEVSLAANTSKDMNKGIGDTVELYFKGDKKSFIVTSIYQTMVDGGTGVRLQRKTIEKYLGNRNETLYATSLKKGEDSKVFVKSISDKYKIVDIKSTPEVFAGFIASAIDNLTYVLLFLLIIFTIITFIIVFNVTLITIFQQKKDLGIYKAIGMLNSQIRASIIYRILLSSLIGIVLGIPASIIGMPRILRFIPPAVGILDFPFINSYSGTLAIIILCIFIVFVSARIASRKVLDIKLNALINE